LANEYLPLKKKCSFNAKNAISKESGRDKQRFFSPENIVQSRIEIH